MQWIYRLPITIKDAVYYLQDKFQNPYINIDEDEYVQQVVSAKVNTFLANQSTNIITLSNNTTLISLEVTCINLFVNARILPKLQISQD